MTVALARVPGVEVFSTGRYQGKVYTHADLDDIVDNFRKFSWGKEARLRPPLAVGHSEDQAIVEGVPRVGQPDSLWREDVTCRECGGSGNSGGCNTCLGTGKQGLLLSNFDKVPKSIAKLIENRAYDSVSSEVYHEPPTGIQGKGKMLKRVSLLGGELPEIKTLKELPLPDYDINAESEQLHGGPRRVVRLKAVKFGRGGSWACFSEVRPMNRDELIRMLVEECGYKAEILDKMPDDHLQELARAHEQHKQDGHHDMEHTDMTEDEKMEQELGKLPKEEAEKKFREHCAGKMSSYAERGKKMFGDAYTFNETKTADGGKAMTFTEAEMKSFTESITKALIPVIKENVLADLKPLTNDVAKFKEDVKKDGLTAFIESRLKTGQIQSFEMDNSGGRPTLLDRLMKTDSTVKCFKFKEGDKEIEQTALEQALAEIDKRPIVNKFAEKIHGADGKGKTDDGTIDPNKPEDREKWAGATFDKFSEPIEKMGIDRVGFIKTAKELKPKDFAENKKYWDDYIKESAA